MQKDRTFICYYVKSLVDVQKVENLIAILKRLKIELLYKSLKIELLLCKKLKLQIQLLLLRAVH